MMEELKRCPFCGGEASTETYEVSTGCDSKGYLAMIRCDCCHAQIKTSVAHEFEKEAAVDEVIKAWNKRSSDENYNQSPPIGVKPGWLCAAQRISELARAIQRYADDEHGAGRRHLIRLWADEIGMQLDIWDEISARQQALLNGEAE